MKERPILFSTEMVRAILEGRKTQTRRIIKFPPSGYPNSWDGGRIEDGKALFYNSTNDREFDAKFPYGQPGDRLWVRETWFNDMSFGSPEYYYRANGEFDEQFERHRLGQVGPFKWRPSIFMPREACRILLEVTDVRVERLYDITEEDARAEGITDVEFYPDEGFPLSVGHMAGKDDGKTSLHTTRVKAYAALWESINGKGAWEKNPWVWVVTFKKLTER